MLSLAHMDNTFHNIVNKILVNCISKLITFHCTAANSFIQMSVNHRMSNKDTLHTAAHFPSLIKNEKNTEMFLLSHTDHDLAQIPHNPLQYAKSQRHFRHEQANCEPVKTLQSLVIRNIHTDQGLQNHLSLPETLTKARKSN